MLLELLFMEIPVVNDHGVFRYHDVIFGVESKEVSLKVYCVRHNGVYYSGASLTTRMGGFGWRPSVYSKPFSDYKQIIRDVIASAIKFLSDDTNAIKRIIKEYQKWEKETLDT